MIVSRPTHFEATPSFDAKRSIRHLIFVGVAVSALLVCGVGGWAATTDFAGAIIAPGRLMVETSIKKVQHPTGGVVGELLVREGQHVRAGQIVLKLDGTQTRASLNIIRQGLDELEARQARDRAERDGLATIEFPSILLSRRDDPNVARLLADEQTLLNTRETGRNGQKAQLREQIAQLEGQTVGILGQIDAKRVETQLNQRELEGVRQLWEKHLVQFTRLADLQREGARLHGEIGRLTAGVAEVKGKIAEIKLKILQVDEDLRTDVGRELADIRGKISELKDKEIAGVDQLKRIDLRAPQDGFVHELVVHTVGGVVAAGESAMMIVPDGEALIVESRIQPGDIDQVRLGQPVVVRFSGLSQRTTPEIDGTISLVSADLTQDEKSGASFYMVRVALTETEIARLGTVRLVPGMPVESFIQTQPRTVMSFLVKPMRDQIEKAFRER